MNRISHRPSQKRAIVVRMARDPANNLMRGAGARWCAERRSDGEEDGAGEGRRRAKIAE
jgi:hypothetical protein